MSRLSYRDRIILLVLVVVVIILIGFFAGVRPLVSTIKTNSNNLEEKQEEWNEIDKEISRIPTLEKRINTLYEESIGIAKEFTEQRTTQDVDKFLQPIIDKNNLVIDGDFSIDEPKVTNMEYYYVTPNILTYPLAEAADLDGSLAEDIAEKMNETLVLSNRTVESVVSTTVTINFNAEKSAILQFIDDIKELEGTILIKNIAINDYLFAEFEEDPELIGKSQGSIVIDFYSVQEVTKPNF